MLPSFCDSQHLDHYIRFLEGFVTQVRLERLKQQFAKRRNDVTFLADQLSHEFNLSAVLRSLDGFGFLDLHLLESSKGMRMRPSIAKGGHKWIVTHRYRSPEDCLHYLRQLGYQIWSTSPSPQTATLSLEEWEWKGPTVFILGQEKWGVQDALQKEAEGSVYIPMYGFVESFNVSVTAALILYILRKKIPEDPVILGDPNRFYQYWLEQHVEPLHEYQQYFLKHVLNK